MENFKNFKDNIKICKILLKLNLLSFNILLNLALILGLNIENRNKDNLINDMITYLKNQNETDINNFQNILEENIPNNLNNQNNTNINEDIKDSESNDSSITTKINNINLDKSKFIKKYIY